ncbi:MAG: IS110 family transposase [Anaerolineae bacterium]|nr:IS110 family transposase [Anaerolineae bacterium]
MDTRIIGIDLAVETAHKAIVLDLMSNRFVTPVLTFHTDPAGMDRVLAAARADAASEVRLVAVLEATAMSWYTVGVYLERQGVEVYRVNGQQVADLRRVYQRHAKSDRIDARVLARLYMTHPERLRRLFLPTGPQMALQRACRELYRLTRLVAASKQRLLATDQFAWLGLEDVVPPYGAAARWVREHWYDPRRVCEAGEAALTKAWEAASPVQPAETSWIPLLCARARQVVALYDEAHRPDYALLQASVTREQSRLQTLQEQERFVRLNVVRPLYRQLHPTRYLETLPGVGQDSAAVYVAFIGDIQRFPSLRDFRGWSGMIPFSRQSGETQARGLHLTQAGPDLIKATAFMDAHVARLYDPQIAAIYYDQMMHKGKHHLQAVCACATHLLDRVYVVLKEERPYELRDVDGRPVTRQEARAICRERYRVPDEVRQRTNVGHRKARREAKTERRYRRRYGDR